MKLVSSSVICGFVGLVMCEVASAATGEPHGFLVANGSFSTVDFPGASSTVAIGINNSRRIVGAFGKENPPYVFLETAHGFLEAGGNFSKIDPPGAGYTFAHGINNADHVVGEFSATIGAPTHGFLYASGNFTTVDVPGASSTIANGINDAEHIIGSFT